MSDSHQTKPISRRRTLIILPDLQKKLIRQCIMWPIATIAVVALLVGFTWQKFIAETADADLDLRSSTFLMAALAVLIIVYAGAMVYQAVVFSNRVAGPIYRVHKTLEAIRAGDLSIRIKLREKDYLLETADQFNQTLDFLEARYAQSKPVAEKTPESTPSPLNATPQSAIASSASLV